MESTSVKVSFNGEMRRFPLQGASYSALYDYVINLLGLQPTTELVLKYTDEDGDLITISSDLELKSAIVPGKVLRVDASLKKGAQVENSAPAGVAGVAPVAPTPTPADFSQPAPMEFGHDAWSYHHRRGPFSGEDWKAFKELRKKDKKAFSREEWAAFKEQFKLEKKMMKEHWKMAQKGHHGHHGHHGPSPYFGPHGAGFRGGRGGMRGFGGRGRGHHGPHGHHAGPHGMPPPFPAPGHDGVPPTENATDAPFVDLTPEDTVGPHGDRAPPPFAPFGFGPHPPFGHHGPPHPHPPFFGHHGPFGHHGFHHPPGFGFGCGDHQKLVARHVKDVTCEDGTTFAPGTAFVKTWRVRNEGAPWPAGCKLIFLSKHSGDSLGGPESVIVEGAVATNQEIDISINLVAPTKPGRYTGYWKMCTPDGRKFGQRVWASIVVPSFNSSSSEGEKEADRYEALVDSVLAMGFSVKRHRVFRLLQKFDGDVSQVCAKLAEKTEKRARKDAARAAKLEAAFAAKSMMTD